MKLTQELVEEHKLIKRMINILESAVKKLEKGETVDLVMFEEAADFIRNFADKFHHAKEEEILFKEAVKKGMPEKDSPIEAMLIEHDQGRNFVKGIIKATDRVKNGNKKAAKEIIENTKGYIELLKEHIDKEDNILYPLTERMFTENEKDKLLDRFKEANQKKGGETTVKKYRDMVIDFETKGNDIIKEGKQVAARHKNCLVWGG